MMSFSKHAKGFPSSSDGHHFVRNMHEFRRENRFFVMFWGTCPIGLLTGMNDSSQATMDSPVTIGRGIIWTLNTFQNDVCSKMPAILSLLQCYIFIKKGSHHTTIIIVPMNHSTTDNQWSKLHMHIQTSHFSRESLCNVTDIYLPHTNESLYSWHQLDSQLSANLIMHPNYHIEAVIKWPPVCWGHHKVFCFVFWVFFVCMCVSKLLYFDWIFFWNLFPICPNNNKPFWPWWAELTHWGRDKWMPFRRRHFQLNFPEWKCFNSD